MMHLLRVCLGVLFKTACCAVRKSAGNKKLLDNCSVIFLIFACFEVYYRKNNDFGDV